MTYGENPSVTIRFQDNEERQQLNEIRTETQKVVGNAQRLSEQLMQIMSV